MQTFQFVEDYIEVIGGFRDPQTNKTVNHNNFWFTFTPIISLARYDVSVLDSMCDNAIANKALTTRQGELAVKIILKYNRQLAQKGVDVSPLLDNVQWRLPLRVMDYSRRMYILDDKIMLEFPFKTELIDGLREFRKDSQGHGEWNKDKKRWEYALTEYNLEYLKTWAEQNQFEVDTETQRLSSLIKQIEAQDYKIELNFGDGALTITNAPETMIEYITLHRGGFDFENLTNLIDLAPVLGYTVEPSIQQAWLDANGTAVNCLTTNHELKVDVTKHNIQDVLTSVVKYADLTNRYPVVIYEPDMSGRFYRELGEIVGFDNILNHRGKKTIETMPEGVKYVYTSAPIKNHNIKLLLCTAGMMFGGDKSLMIQNTEKAIYFAPEVYTNKKEHKVAEFAS